MSQKKKKLLLADSSKKLLSSLVEAKEAALYDIITVDTGSACLQQLDKFQPDLVVLDLMLPQMHGIELLGKIRTGPSMAQKMGVILTSYCTLPQNHSSAVLAGANYVLNKPFAVEHLYALIAQFFTKGLQPDPFAISQEMESPAQAPTLPHTDSPSCYLKFWGTRGSNPVSGAEYVRFGGNTPTLEIRCGKDLVIIDAGSGIRALGQTLLNESFEEIPILFSHTHLDHLAGLPFFYPLHQTGKKIHIWAPVGFEQPTSEVFSNLFAYPYFPVAFDNLRSHLSFSDLRDGQKLSFGQIHVSTHYAFHPGSTLCFKLSIGDKKIGYVTDNEFLQGCHLPLDAIEQHEELFDPYLSLIDFLRGCDLLIHEAQYTPEEYKTRVGWGHSSVFNAAFLLKKTGIKHWIICHHDPRHTDEFLLDKQQMHRQTLQAIGYEDCIVQLAYDGMMLPL